ncbi:MAG: hypothetical protein OWT27_03810, partial [Firmicutes bacterium]|nr:hypothetical protein [Bacillota bacterium]
MAEVSERDAQDPMLPFTPEDALSATGERIVADRYLLKDARKETLSVGSLVMAVLDKKRSLHELARVVATSAADRTVEIELRDGFRTTVGTDDVDVLQETSPRQMWRRIARG